jgi:hypothetical protein
MSIPDCCACDAYDDPPPNAGNSLVSSISAWNPFAHATMAYLLMYATQSLVELCLRFLQKGTRPAAVPVSPMVYWAAATLLSEHPRSRSTLDLGLTAPFDDNLKAVASSERRLYSQ